VRIAVTAGAIALERYQSYVKLHGELTEVERLRETHGR
jgi:putative ribosome biogenesis GTPase RsgA